MIVATAVRFRFRSSAVHLQPDCILFFLLQHPPRSTRLRSAALLQSAKCEGLSALIVATAVRFLIRSSAVHLQLDCKLDSHRQHSSPVPC